VRKGHVGQRPASAPVQSLEAELARLRDLGIADLRALWRTMTRSSPPPALTGDLLARMIAYRIQEQRIGKLDRDTRKLLDALAVGGTEPVRRLKIGTVLVREHAGVVHEVMVVPGGFHWDGQTYPSLSAVAHAITGTNWNGLRFFGVRHAKGSAAAESEPAGTEPRPAAVQRGSVRANVHVRSSFSRGENRP
jgi:hypothetical protein